MKMNFLSLAFLIFSLASESAIAITYESYQNQRDTIIEEIYENQKKLELPRDRTTRFMQIEAVLRLRRARIITRTGTPLHPHDIRMLKKELRIGKAISKLKSDFSPLDLLNDYRNRVEKIDSVLGNSDQAKLEKLMNEKLQTWSTQSSPMSNTDIDEYFYRLQSIEEILAKYEHEVHGPPKLSPGITTKTTDGEPQQIQPGHGILAVPTQ